MFDGICSIFSQIRCLASGADGTPTGARSDGHTCNGVERAQRRYRHSAQALAASCILKPKASFMLVAETEFPEFLFFFFFFSV